jgi:uroporphyrinogen decarboxylase
MNSRERMCKVLNHESPDRVPTWEYAIDRVVYEKLCPGGSYPDVVELLDLDAAAAFEPSCGGYVPGLLDDMKDGETFRDEWGVKRQFCGEMLAYPMEEDVPITNEADLKNYTPPDPNADSRFDRLREHARRFRGEKLNVYAILGIWELSKYLMGIQEFLLAFRRRPDMIKGVFELITDWIVEVSKNAIDSGADMVMIADDLGHKTGLFAPPELLNEFYIPCLKRVVEAVRKRRAYTFFHSHGNIWKIVDRVIATGIDVLHPMAYEDQMDIRIVKKIFGDRVVVAGNIATGALIDQSRDEVVRLVQDTINDTSAGGGHIMMASSSIYSGINPDNYRAMIETVHEYGKY